MKLPVSLIIFAVIFFLFPIGDFQIKAQVILSLALYEFCLLNTKIYVNGSRMESCNDIHVKTACLGLAFLFIEIWKVSFACLIGFITDMSYYDVLDTSYCGYILLITGFIVCAGLIMIIKRKTECKELNGFRKSELI